MQQIKNMFFTAETSNVLHFSVKKGPICFWLLKKEYYFLCVLPTADKYFCGWTFKEKHVFQSLPAFLLPCFTQLQERVSSEEGGGSCAFYYMSFFPRSSFAYRNKTRQNMFSFIKKGNYSYSFCQLKKIYIFFCSKGQADDLHFIYK